MKYYERVGYAFSRESGAVMNFTVTKCMGCGSTQVGVTDGGSCYNPTLFECTYCGNRW